ncbi:hypothetical protein FRC11_013146 [Ceratobasidium sp. 423]|nr:hypothetical protein FRC11_013146 [Ceratobasidium sp. 423]
MPSELYRPFVDITGNGSTLSYAEHHPLILPPSPIRNAWYRSSARDAGMLAHPKYFVDVGNDGKQNVFCWSLSLYNGGVTNYLWRVYWDFQMEPILVLCQQIHHQESLHFGFGAYQFHVLSPDSRAIWREVKTSGVFDQSNHRVALYPDIQLNWFGSSNLASNLNMAIQRQAQALQDYPYEMADNLAQDFGNLFVNPTETSFSAVPTPSTQGSDTSSIASADAFSPETGVENVAGDSEQYFTADETGIPILMIPRCLESQEAVKDFITKALNSGQLDKGVRHVKCSGCKNKKTEKTWEIKPSNLEAIPALFMAVRLILQQGIK